MSKRRKKCCLVIGVTIFALLVLWMIWGNSILPLRFNNRPEVILIQLKIP